MSQWEPSYPVSHFTWHMQLKKKLFCTCASFVSTQECSSMQSKQNKKRKIHQFLGFSWVLQRAQNPQMIIMSWNVVMENARNVNQICQPSILKTPRTGHITNLNLSKKSKPANVMEKKNYPGKQNVSPKQIHQMKF